MSGSLLVHTSVHCDSVSSVECVNPEARSGPGTIIRVIVFRIIGFMKTKTTSKGETVILVVHTMFPRIDWTT